MSITEPATDVITNACWLASGSGPLSVRVTRSESGIGSGLGVVLLPPISYELSSSYRALRLMAEQLAARGVLVLRVDYSCTGDSAGLSTDVTLATLREALPVCVAELRAQGALRVTAVGLLMGGLLALLDAGSAGVEEVVAWAPVQPGRKYVRSMTMMGERPPSDAGLEADSVLIGGYLAPGRLLKELQTLSPDDVNLVGVERVVIANRDDRPLDLGLAEVVARRVLVLETLELPGHPEFIDAPAEDAIIPLLAIKGLVGAIAPKADVGEVRWNLSTLPYRAPMNNAIDEEHVVLGRRATVGVRTAVSSGSAASAALVFLNSGSDPHYGPSRAWVDLARLLASPNLDVFRTDFTGWGDSPPDPRATGRPYDLHVVDDIEAVSAALHATGYARVIFVGLCASAWLALHAARVAPLGGEKPDMVVAINPQLYWGPGDPVEALMTDTRRRRAEEIKNIAAQADTGVFDAEDAAGRLCEAAAWLQELTDARVPVHLLFAENDDGLIYLRQRMGRRLHALTESGALRVTEMAGVDHSMSRIWKRPAVASALIDALAIT